MSRLILSLQGQTLAEYNMTKERYTVGRLPDNDVRIDNPAVSGHHSLIINILNDSFLEDLNSTNGTYVNGRLIKKHALQHGDVITIGQHQIRFVEENVDEADQEEFEKTMVINPRTQSQVAMEHAREAVTAAAKSNDGEAGKSVEIAKLQVLSGQFAGRELELVKALTTLGRQGGQVAAITRRSDGYYIVQVSAAGGGSPTVNGQKIGNQARRLEDSDVIELGGVKMGFFTS
ncbi:MAG: FHA domain-containing protein [Gammaproteobacteria bacterium]|jgi:pSer/pThr/pTyr-binding forkhead associated (FHA) protein